MLSQAATTHIGEPETIAGQKIVEESTMMSGPWGMTPGPDGPTGLTPFLSFMDNQQAQLASDRPEVDRQESGASSHVNIDYNNPSRRTSQQGSNDSPLNIGPNRTMSDIFPQNATYDTTIPSSEPRACGLAWQSVDADFGRPAGTWRQVDTTKNTFGQSGAKLPEVTPAPIQISDLIDENNGSGIDAETQQQILLDLFWPGWPPQVPQPHILHELANAFFDLVPNIPRMLNRARFLARLALPPTHSNFPHPSLLHAVCASAAAWVDPKTYMGTVTAEYPNILPTSAGAHYRSNLSGAQAKWTWGENVFDSTFGTQQAHYGKEAVQEGLNTGNRLFDVVRAMIIFSRVFIDDTRYAIRVT
jgi:hypothetical protein